MGSIVWIASYPKSGNTWIRLLLANYLSDAGPVDINTIGSGPIASSREAFDDIVGIDAADLTPQEILSYRPDTYRLWSEAGLVPRFVKAHDAQARIPDGRWLFPAEASAGAIYAIRNPLDVVVSFAHHSGVGLDTAITRMCRDDFSMSVSRERQSEQLEQMLFSWSGHVRSWVDQSAIPIHVVRYEDLFADPTAQFKAIVEFAGLAFEELRLQNAVEYSRFDRLRVQEQDRGFRERATKATAPFFRQGHPGGWREVLSDAQVQALMDAHGSLMRRFGYLTSDGEPVSGDDVRGELSGSG